MVNPSRTLIRVLITIMYKGAIKSSNSYLTLTYNGRYSPTHNDHDGQTSEGCATDDESTRQDNDKNAKAHSKSGVGVQVL